MTFLDEPMEDVKPDESGEEADRTLWQKVQDRLRRDDPVGTDDDDPPELPDLWQ